MLVTNGNKNNWSQTSPCRRINSRGEKVKGWTQGIDEHSCETLQCLNVYVYECIKSVEIELVNENGCLNLKISEITWTNVTFCLKSTILIPVFPTTRIFPWKQTHLIAIKQVGNFVQDVLETKTSTVMQIIRNLATTLHVIPLLVTHCSIFSRASMTACRMTKVL